MQSTNEKYSEDNETVGTHGNTYNYGTHGNIFTIMELTETINNNKNVFYYSKLLKELPIGHMFF